MDLDHFIERAKTGRAACRACKIKIEKSELRLAHEVLKRPGVPGAIDTTHRFYHLKCAAKSQPAALKEAIDKFDGELPLLSELHTILNAAANTKRAERSKTRDSSDSFPFAERSPSGRAKCLACGEKVAKDTLRVVVEREVNTPNFTGKTKGYYHLKCSRQAIGDDDLLAKLTAHSSLDATELASIEQALT